MNLYSTRAATVVALIQLTLYMNGQLLNHEVWKRVRDCMLCYSTKTVPLFVIRTKMLQHYDWAIQETFGKLVLIILISEVNNVNVLCEVILHAFGKKPVDNC